MVDNFNPCLGNVKRRTDQRIHILQKRLAGAANADRPGRRDAEHNLQLQQPRPVDSSQRITELPKQRPDFRQLHLRFDLEIVVDLRQQKKIKHIRS